MTVEFLKRSFWQRLLGIPATSGPSDPGSWQYDQGTLTVDLDRTPELTSAGGALRLEGQGLPQRVLIIHADDGSFFAFHNRCTHFGHRRLDPVPGTATVQCCSVNRSTYDLGGEKIFGPAPRPIKSYPLTVEGRQLIVAMA